jgi:hypothetical protein
MKNLRADRGLVVDRAVKETGFDLASFVIGAAAGMILLAFLYASIR